MLSEWRDLERRIYQFMYSAPRDPEPLATIFAKDEGFLPLTGAVIYTAILTVTNYPPYSSADSGEPNRVYAGKFGWITQPSAFFAKGMQPGFEFA